MLQALESFDIVFLDIIMQEHGIGLLNVGDVADKYNRAVNTAAENGIFAISILMPFPDAEYDIKTAV